MDTPHFDGQGTFYLQNLRTWLNEDPDMDGFVTFDSYGPGQGVGKVKLDEERRTAGANRQHHIAHHIANNLPLVASLLTSPIIPTPFSIRFAHRSGFTPPTLPTTTLTLGFSTLCLADFWSP